MTEIKSESIFLDGGKYEVVFDQSGYSTEFYALRYGEKWRSLTGDNLVLCLFQRIQDLEDKLYTSIK
ncbi:MAG TPA: hypothetical protein VIM42_11395 [Clostridium sp.]